MVASLLTTVREQLRESRVEHARRVSLERENWPAPTAPPT